MMHGSKLIWSPSGSLPTDLFRLTCHGLIAAILLSFMGEFMPLGDSLAVFRIEMTCVLMMCGGVAARIGRGVLPAIICVVSLLVGFSLLPYAGRQAVSADREITLFQQNLYFGNRHHGELLGALDLHRPNVVTLQEIGTRNQPLINALTNRYPHYHLCAYNTGGVAVFAEDIGERVDAGCIDGEKLAWLTLETVEGRITFVSVHLFWPWPRQQYWQIDGYANAISALSGSRIIGGDFNMVPWAASVGRIARAAEGRVVPGLRASYHLAKGLVTFRIDHVIAPRAWTARTERLGKLGSDHNAILATIDAGQDGS